MADLWYYLHDTIRTGPCSGRQLKNLADDGTLLPTDTVWKEGVERGVPASRVKNLFQPTAPVPAPPVPPAEPPVAVTAPAPAPVGADAGPMPLPQRFKPSAPPQPERPRRAVAGKGALVVGQDGHTVKFRKKCTVCGEVDASWNNAPIRAGVIRAAFYCKKCRKSREVEVHCYQH